MSTEGNEPARDVPTTDPAQPQANPPADPRAWDAPSRVEALADWIVVHRRSFTDEALRRSAEAGGYTPAEFTEALRVLETRVANRKSLTPVRLWALSGAIAAYAATWLAFAALYGREPKPSGLDMRSFLEGFLAIALIVGLIVSMIAIRLRHPNAERGARAVAILLVIPLVILLGISGLCAVASGFVTPIDTIPILVIAPGG